LGFYGKLYKGFAIFGQDIIFPLLTLRHPIRGGSLTGGGVVGALRGCPPQRGVAEDRRAEARGETRTCKASPTPLGLLELQ
jgi:hypothetical protein